MVDLKLTPVGAYRLTGLPLSELAGACVPVGDVFGRAGAELAGTTPSDFVSRLNLWSFGTDDPPLRGRVRR